MAYDLHEVMRWGIERTRKMRMKSILAGSMLALTVAGCANGIPADMSVAEYCADADRASEDVCRLNGRIE